MFVAADFLLVLRSTAYHYTTVYNYGRYVKSEQYEVIVEYGVGVRSTEGRW